MSYAVLPGNSENSLSRQHDSETFALGDMYRITPSVVNKHCNLSSLTVTSLSAVSLCPCSLETEKRGVSDVPVAMSQ